MADNFLGEIRINSFVVVPQGWALCDGQLLPINQNQPLFSLLGTTYGGNGTTNFALPNLEARVPIHVGPGFSLGQAGGEANHVLTLGETPTHTHGVNASTSSATVNVATGAWLANSIADVYTASSAQPTTLASAELGNVGSGQAHVNEQPYLTLSFCIALTGIYPSPD